MWWGVRGAPTQLLDIPDEPALAGLFPRPIDDWSEAPRALVLAALDAERAAASLAPALPGRWHDAGPDEQLGANVWRLPVGRSALLLAEPIDRGIHRGMPGALRRGADRDCARWDHRGGPERGPLAGQRRAGDVRADRSRYRADVHLPARPWLTRSSFGPSRPGAPSAMQRFVGHGAG